MTQLHDTDVAIIGGGPAGLQAALIVGRARRRVVVVDADTPSHYAAESVHGVLGFEGTPPRELRTHAWRELSDFDVTRLTDRATRARVLSDSCFEIGLASGSSVSAARVVLAGGLRYRPSVDAPGIEELWGGRVFHCPFCHGWEVRGGRIGVIGATAAQLEHVTSLLTLWTDDIAPIAGAVSRIEVRDDDALWIHHSDGVDAVDAALCPPRYEIVDDIPEQLGLVRVVNEMMSSDPLQVDVDEWGATSAPGVFVAGDLSASMPSASMAIASGARAAFGVVRSYL